MRAALGDLVHDIHRDPRGADGAPGAPRRDKGKAKFVQFARDIDGLRPVGRLDADEHLAGCRQPGAGSQLRLDEGFAEAASDAHHLAGRLHLGTEDGIDTGELDEGKNRFLDREIRRNDFAGYALIGQAAPRHAARGDLRQRQAGGLRDEGHRARGARIDFEHVDHRIVAPPLNGELHVHQTDDVETLGHHLGLAAQLVLDLLREGKRRQRTGGVARMHARLLDVLHDAAYQHLSAVAQGIDIDLGGVVEEAVEQHRRSEGDLDRIAHVALEILLLMDDFHGAAAQHIGRPHHQRITDLGREADRVRFGARRTVRRLLQAQVVQQFLEALAVLGGVDHVGAGADDRHAVRFEFAGTFERCLAAELHDDAGRLLDMDDFEDVLQGHRFEIQAIGRVVVGGHRLRIAVDHDGLIAVFAHRQRRMHAAVVEFDALTNPVGTSAQHHDLLLRGRP